MTSPVRVSTSKRKELRFRNGELLRIPADQHPLDKLIRAAVGDGGMFDGTLVQITYTNVFEGWDSYESWGQGWTVTFYDTKTKLPIGQGKSHYLDSAIEYAVNQVNLESMVENKLGPDYQ